MAKVYSKNESPLVPLPTNSFIPERDLDKMMEAIRIELGERKLRFLEGNKKALVAGMEAAK